MDEEKRRSAGLGTILVLIVVISAGWFMWANLLNFGKVQVYAETPFSVETESGEIFVCAQSPCEIKQKIGRKNLVVSKEGLDSEVESVRFRLWRTVDLEVEFDFQPTLSEVDSYEAIDNSLQLELEYRASSDLQALVDEDGDDILFFPEVLTNPRIFASDKSALILSPDGNYRVDIQGKTRNSIAPLDIFQAKWSLDGTHLLFQSEENGPLSVLDQESEVIEFISEQSFEQLHWTADNQLAFLGEGTTLHFADLTGEVVEIIDFILDDELQPENLYMQPNGAAAYFSASGQAYRLMLR